MMNIGRTFAFLHSFDWSNADEYCQFYFSTRLQSIELVCQIGFGHELPIFSPISNDFAMDWHIRSNSMPFMISLKHFQLFLRHSEFLDGNKLAKMLKIASFIKKSEFEFFDRDKKTAGISLNLRFWVELCHFYDNNSHCKKIEFYSRIRIKLISSKF